MKEQNQILGEGYKNLKQIYDEVKFVKNKYISNKNLIIDIDFNPKKL